MTTMTTAEAMATVPSPTKNQLRLARDIPRFRADGHGCPPRRRVRTVYIHTTCGGSTTLPDALAEAWAATPRLREQTHCAICGALEPVNKFRWKDTGTVLG